MANTAFVILRVEYTMRRTVKLINHIRKHKNHA